MCKILKICRSTYCYEVNAVKRAEKEEQEHILTESIISTGRNKSGELVLRD